MVEEMTYKLNSELNKIESPINLIFPNGESKKYVNGEAVTEEVFDEAYSVSSITANNNSIQITLCVRSLVPLEWCGNERMSFF